MSTMKAVSMKYVATDHVPAGLRWDTPAQNQGQIVDVSYANCPTEASPAESGAMYRRVFDASDRTTEYYVARRAALCTTKPVIIIRHVEGHSGYDHYADEVILLAQREQRRTVAGVRGALRRAWRAVRPHVAIGPTFAVSRG